MTTWRQMEADFGDRPIKDIQAPRTSFQMAIYFIYIRITPEPKKHIFSYK